ncbi:MAG: hypothetical protein ACRBBK_07695 [Paracoccaceae bacterium]
MMAFPENVQELVSVAAIYALDGAPFTAADRLHKAADALKMGAIAAGYPIPEAMQTKLKPLDADLAWALQYAEEDAQFSAEFNGEDGYTTADARRLETVLRRLAREAGYALPETAQTAGGSHD